MKIIQGKETFIKSWCNNPEQEAIEQALNLASLPFVFRHVALMPDVHKGYGMTIGGVIATKDVIIPNAVGKDISCGMCAVQTSLTEITQEQIKILFGGSKEHHGGIRELIPVGFNKHSKPQDNSLMPSITDLHFGLTDQQSEELIITKEYNNDAFKVKYFLYHIDINKQYFIIILSRMPLFLGGYHGERQKRRGTRKGFCGQGQKV